ncbi:MAG: DUF6524 family protein [Paracoccaceae bacterium]|nr:DUF6524 family protein [Paracoccaceae bacterium]
MSFLLRWFLAFILIAATFNPTEYSYFSWVRANFSAQMPLAVFMGLILLVSYIIYLRATLRSIGGSGMILVGALTASLLWVMIDRGWLSLSDRSQTIWLAILVMSVIFGVGLSWSIIRRSISGQYTEDDADD